MYGLFNTLRQALQVKTTGDIVQYVKEHSLGLHQLPTQSPEELPFFEESWWDDNPLAFDPCVVRDLRDCAHWKIILRLIAQGKEPLFQEDVKSVLNSHQMQD